jgi:hypothetical protein
LASSTMFWMTDSLQLQHLSSWARMYEALRLTKWVLAVMATLENYRVLSHALAQEHYNETVLNGVWVYCIWLRIFLN